MGHSGRNVDNLFQFGLGVGSMASNRVTLNLFSRAILGNDVAELAGLTVVAVM